MKNLTALVLVVLSLQNLAQEKRLIEVPKIDKRVELLSIVFRLAGNAEYNATDFKLYNDKVANHFGAFKGHALVQFAKELKVKGITYEAVMNMAVMLDTNLNPLIDFSTTVPERWSEDDANKFISLLKVFYKDADCEEFFRENEELFKDVSNRFSPVYQTLDLNWFQSFYGKKADENFNIIISIGCGRQNYGTSYVFSDTEKNVFAIMGSWKMDESGLPVYNQGEYLLIIIHEFSHPFVNPFTEKYRESFEESGKEIYKAVEYEMSRQQPYGDWQIMLNEALVRASVIKYLIDHGTGESEIQRLLNSETNKGFLWIKGLVNELKKYANQRDKYPTLESYIPNLSTAYRAFAEKISQYDAQRPKVKSITEFANNDTNVSHQLKTITINFDRQLSGEGSLVNTGNKEELALPKIDRIYYTLDNKSVVMEVQLKPNQEYQFILTGRNFKTLEGIPLKTFEVNFKTAE